MSDDDIETAIAGMGETLAARLPGSDDETPEADGKWYLPQDVDAGSIVDDGRDDRMTPNLVYKSDDARRLVIEHLEQAIATVKECTDDPYVELFALCVSRDGEIGFFHTPSKNLAEAIGYTELLKAKLIERIQQEG